MVEISIQASTRRYLFQSTIFWRDCFPHMLGHVGPLRAPLGAALRHGRHRAASPLLLPRLPRYAHLHTEMDRPLEDRLQDYLHCSLLLAHRNCGKLSCHYVRRILRTKRKHTIDPSLRNSYSNIPLSPDVLLNAIFHEPQYFSWLSSHVKRCFHSQSSP